MKKRIGNDIPIVWKLTDGEGNPYDLTGKEFSVCMKLEGMCVYIPMVYTFTENVISFTFCGKDQPGTGIYDLILREGDSEVTYDVQGVVELVPHSWDEDEGDIDIESEIATNGEVNVIEVVKVNGVALPVVDKAVDVIAVQPVDANAPTKVWAGTAEQYEALTPSDDTIYFIKED